MKRFIKNNLFGFVIGTIIFGSIGVYATHKYQAKDISYKDTDVESAVNDLYGRVNGSVSKLSKSENFNNSNYFSSTATDNNLILDGMCFQILRVTDDNEMRIIYNGVADNGECHQQTSTSQIGTSKYSTTYNAQNKYSDSPVKEVVDNWYNEHITSKSKVEKTGLITKNEVDSIGTSENSYLKTGFDYWTSTASGTEISENFTITCTACGNETLTVKSNGVYRINSNGEVSITNNGTFDKHQDAKTKTCNGSCAAYWSDRRCASMGYPSISQCGICDLSYNEGYGCCSYNKVTGSCSAISSDGSILAIRPVLNIKSSVAISKGNGTYENPYQVK